VILVGLGGFRRRAIASAARWTVRLTLIIVLVEFGFGLHGALMSLIGTSVAELAVYRYFVRPSLSGQEVFPLRAMLGYVAPLFVFSMSMRLFDRTDLLLVTWPALGGSIDQAGVFGAAQQMALLPALFTGAFSPLLLSTLSHQLSRGRHESARLIARQGLRVALLLLPLAALVAALADATVRMVFGTQFEAAGPLLAILFLGSCARVVVSVGTSILTAIGRPRLCSWIGLPMWLTLITTQLVMIPRFGITGAAVATTAVACLGAIATVLLVDHAWALRPPVGAAVGSAAVSVLVFGVASALPDARSWILPNYLIGVAVIGLAFLGLGEFNPAERSLLRSAIGRLVQPSWRASETV
jgi:O-antigen/teichoic acid export membrane protein